MNENIEKEIIIKAIEWNLNCIVSYFNQMSYFVERFFKEKPTSYRTCKCILEYITSSIKCNANMALHSSDDVEIYDKEKYNNFFDKIIRNIEAIETFRISKIDCENENKFAKNDFIINHIHKWSFRLGKLSQKMLNDLRNTKFHERI